MEWISVDDEVPYPMEEVMIVFEAGMIRPGYYWDGEDWYSYESNQSGEEVLTFTEQVTHWMRFPPPPHVEELAVARMGCGEIKDGENE